MVTHLWHAKRFHMETLWGWRVPYDSIVDNVDIIFKVDQAVHSLVGQITSDPEQNMKTRYDFGLLSRRPQPFPRPKLQGCHKRTPCDLTHSSNLHMWLRLLPH